MFVGRKAPFQVLTIPVPYYKKALEATKNQIFKGVPLHSKNRVNHPLIQINHFTTLKSIPGKTYMGEADPEIFIG